MAAPFGEGMVGVRLKRGVDVIIREVLVDPRHGSEQIVGGICRLRDDFMKSFGKRGLILYRLRTQVRIETGWPVGDRRDFRRVQIPMQFPDASLEAMPDDLASLRIG